MVKELETAPDPIVRSYTRPSCTMSDFSLDSLNLLPFATLSTFDAHWQLSVTLYFAVSDYYWRLPASQIFVLSFMASILPWFSEK